MTAELVYTFPRCCYAGCFPKLLVKLRAERRILSPPGSTTSVRFIGFDREGLLTPADERLAIDVRIDSTGSRRP